MCGAQHKKTALGCKLHLRDLLTALIGEAYEGGAILVTVYGS
jgi:hypothetical protein